MQNSNDVPPELWFGMAGMVLVMVIIFALYLTAVICSMIWVAKDAEARGKSGVLLAVLTWFTWPLGLLVWVIARPELPRMPPPMPMPPPPPLPPS